MPDEQPFDTRSSLNVTFCVRTVLSSYFTDAYRIAQSETSSFSLAAVSLRCPAYASFAKELFGLPPVRGWLQLCSTPDVPKPSGSLAAPIPPGSTERSGAHPDPGGRRLLGSPPREGVRCERCRPSPAQKRVPPHVPAHGHSPARLSPAGPAWHHRRPGEPSCPSGR